MREFVRLRLDCHDLPVEVGRHAGVPRRDRLCLRCTLGAVCDEKHMILSAQRLPICERSMKPFWG